MSLKIALQMDPIENINIFADSTFALGLEAQARGHKLYYYQPKDMVLRQDHLYAYGSHISLRNEEGNHFETHEDDMFLDLHEMDVVLLRQDPPFDMGYITTTHFLDHLEDDCLVVNNPKYVRNAPEKIFITRFPDLMPETLITSCVKEILKFRAEYKDIIVKPLYGNGGSGVFHIKPDDENLASLLEMFEEKDNEPMIIQRYLPEIRQGDKRVILIDGHPVGAVNRIPEQGSARANFHAGGKAGKTELTPRDLEICERIKPILQEQNLIFVGIDIIGDYLTEINVTSPTGIREINALEDICIERIFWDVVEKKYLDRPVLKSVIKP